MGHLKASTFLSRLKDPNAWVCLIAVFVVLGLLGGAFEPLEPERMHDAGMGDGGMLEVALAAPVKAHQPG